MDKRAVHEKALLKRLVISFYDLTEARQFLNRLLGLNGETAPPIEDRLTRAALQTALVVGYARPFSNNEQAPGVLPDLPGRFLKALTAEQLRVHSSILAFRNKEFAHSDADRAEVQVFVGQYNDGRPLASPVSNVTRGPLRTEDLRVLDSLFEHFHTRIYDEMRRWEAGLTPGESF